MDPSVSFDAKFKAASGMLLWHSKVGTIEVCLLMLFQRASTGFIRFLRVAIIPLYEFNAFASGIGSQELWLSVFRVREK